MPNNKDWFGCTYTNFVKEGAKADDVSKEKISAINQKLAALFKT
jgi:Zn-dependent oligopeptidase